jgi:hypothetical protein
MTEDSKESKEEVKEVKTIEVEATSEKLQTLKDVSLSKIETLPTQELAQIILDSGLAPKALKTVQSIMIAMQMGKELGFKEITSLNYINVIDNKPTLSVHALSALIKNIGIEYQLKEDAVNVYADGTTSSINRYEYEPDGKTFKLNTEGKRIKINPNDVRTTITFIRKWNGIILKDDISFTLKEAQAQGLSDKDNWKKMLKIMLRARALAIGARFVAPQVFMGLYETSEILDSRGIEYEMDENGNITSIS